MKERPVDRKRAVVAHNESSEVPEPREGALDRPAPLVAPEHAAIWRRCPVAVRAVRYDQQDAPPPQSLAQRVTVLALVGNHA